MRTKWVFVEAIKNTFVLIFSRYFLLVKTLGISSKADIDYDQHSGDLSVGYEKFATLENKPSEYSVMDGIYLVS